MSAVSIISTMNVLRFRKRSSFAPTREKIASTMPIRAADAGTKEPVWARMAIKAVCRNSVDLPAMFGPVTTWRGLSAANVTVFGIKVFPVASSPSSTVGCRPSTMP